MIAQRMPPGGAVLIGRTPEFIGEIFDEELNRILRELPEGTDAAVSEKYREARRASEQMITRGWFDPV
ncbi:MAG TPA: hypothetical protein VFD58_20135 [Blastocatellia bacterium]|nr:hypothetical protein [Blastocatellia bacterium]